MREIVRKLRNSQRWKSLVVITAAVLAVSFVTTVCLGCSYEVEEFFCGKHILTSQKVRESTDKLSSRQDCSRFCVAEQIQKQVSACGQECLDPLEETYGDACGNCCGSELSSFCKTINELNVCERNNITEIEKTDPAPSMAEKEEMKQALPAMEKEETKQKQPVMEMEVIEQTVPVKEAEDEKQLPSQIGEEKKEEITSNADWTPDCSQEVIAKETQEQMETAPVMAEAEKNMPLSDERETDDCCKAPVDENEILKETEEIQAEDLIEQITQYGGCRNGQVVIVNGRCIDVKDLLQDTTWNWQSILQETGLPSQAQNANSQYGKDQDVTDQNVINQNGNTQNVINQNGNAQNVPNQNGNTQNDNNPMEQNTAFVDEVIRLVNQERAKAGLPALSKNSSLCTVANVRAGEIITVFDHTRPNGKNCFSILSEYNIMYRAAGENIAWGQTSPQQVMEGWMNSSGHRANILSANFSEIGVGVVYSGGRYYWAQMFIG